ncbi:glucosaminidase domain-containing protein [Bizionia paragorgiae]|uniref:glucosaminidase domain-containing protein n=1 Tax=Bizionia paragorgiae TaxID=283786 RepID=UPI00299F49C2|nr:glucosaminidase domain-containing protein [Bizionia paragorgiae]MDX1272233.1 glucosaminidase domain-containing protein [Bizionia paragorgiae]
MKKIFTIICLSVLVLSCGSRKKVVTSKTKTKTERVTRQPKTPTEEKVVIVAPKEESKPVSSGYANATEAYIANYSGIAKDEMRDYGIPASITLAQGILESGSGNGRLSVEANNHFGIKCHREWTGDKIYHDDDAAQECFRKYKHSKYSFRDHSLFLKERKRYAGLFKLAIDDYEAWAKGLKAAGYATDRKYPDKLISLIERYQLYQYDLEVLGKTPAKRPVVKNEDKHIVVAGDTLYSLSRKYNMTVKELQELNGLKSNELAIGQELYIK